MRPIAQFNRKNAGKPGRAVASMNNIKNRKPPQSEMIGSKLSDLVGIEGKGAKIQRQEEDELQMKSVMQRQEEEEVQAKPSAPWIQQQPLEEEEEMIQPKPWVQTKAEKQQGAAKKSSPENWVQKQVIEEEEMQMKDSRQSTPTNGSPGGIKTKLPADVRKKMEGAFDTDFRNVNIRRDSRNAARMSALAYTSGNEIHFSPGQYRPSTVKGQELIGHELTHVVQQRAGKVISGRQFSFGRVNNDPALEKEADVMGKKAASGEKGLNLHGKGPLTAKAGSIQAKTTAEKLKEFRSTKHEESNFIPSTNRGLFDVSLNPINGRLEIRLKVGFNFKDGPAAAFAKFKGVSEKWSEAEKKSWKKKYTALIEGRWGGKYHFVNPDLPGVTVYVDVEIEKAESNWHYQLNVTKAPPGEMPTSSVTHFVKDDKALKKLNKHYSTLDSNDLKWKDLTKRAGVSEKQKGAVHEFGHMIGLDDEYDDKEAGISHAALVQSALGKKIKEGDSDDIMSCGNSINKQHYVTFLDALNKVTGMNNWKFKNP